MSTQIYMTVPRNGSKGTDTGAALAISGHQVDSRYKAVMPRLYRGPQTADVSEWTFIGLLNATMASSGKLFRTIWAAEEP